MKKVAIVGVEGSGKTVMLAGLAALYERPDAEGYFFDPCDPETFWYASDQIALMRQGKWPAATNVDAKKNLTWTLCQKGEGRPKKIADLTFLDFAGEVYRAAFGVKKNEDLADEAHELQQYVQDADVLLVLVNLSDVIRGNGFDARVRESMWLTKSILDWASDEGKDRHPKMAIVLSQCDLYQATIDACGGPRAVLEKHLPIVGNNYSWLDILAVSSVDKTKLDKEGLPVPEPDFKSSGLAALLSWIVGSPTENRDGSNARMSSPKNLVLRNNEFYKLVQNDGTIRVIANASGRVSLSSPEITTFAVDPMGMIFGKNEISFYKDGGESGVAIDSPCAGVVNMTMTNKDRYFKADDELATIIDQS